MRTHAIHLTSAFATRLALVFLVLHAFVALLLVLGVYAAAPHLAMVDVAASLPDLLLLALPVTLPICALIATCMALSHARRHGVFLTFRLTGGDARRAFLPSLGLCLVLGAASWWLSAFSLPGAHRAVEERTVALADDPRAVAMFLATHPRALGRMTVDFDRADDRGLTGFRADVRDGGVVAARHATVRTAGPVTNAAETETERITLALDQGRWLRADGQGRLQQNLRFDRLALALDGREFRGPSLRGLPDLRYVREDELDRLVDQERYLTRRGVRPSRTQRKRVARRRAVRLSRIQGGLLVPSFALLAVIALGAGIDRPRRRMFVGVAVLCLAVLLPQHLLLQTAARDGEIRAAWLTLLPSVEATVVAASLLAGELISRRRRR